MADDFIIRLSTVKSDFIPGLTKIRAEDGFPFSTLVFYYFRSRLFKQEINFHMPGKLYYTDRKYYEVENEEYGSTINDRMYFFCFASHDLGYYIEDEACCYTI